MLKERLRDINIWVLQHTECMVKLTEFFIHTHIFIQLIDFEEAAKAAAQTDVIV